MGYAKVSLSVNYSENSDYSDSITPFIEPYELTVEQGMILPVLADTGGTTVDLGTFTTTVTTVIIVNQDPTNFVNVTYTYNSTSRVNKVLAGGYLILGSVTASADLSLAADTADCKCLVIALGDAAA